MSKAKNLKFFFSQKSFLENPQTNKDVIYNSYLNNRHNLHKQNRFQQGCQNCFQIILKIFFNKFFKIIFKIILKIVFNKVLKIVFKISLKIVFDKVLKMVFDKIIIIIICVNRQMEVLHPKKLYRSHQNGVNKNQKQNLSFQSAKLRMRKSILMIRRPMNMFLHVKVMKLI